MKQIKTAPFTNIVNSKKWDKSQHLSHFQNRLSAMRAKREQFEQQFKKWEQQETAYSFYDNFGELQIVVPLEQIMTEIYLGRTNGKVIYDIIPDGQANVDDLQPAKYALSFFLDGNEKDNFWKENKAFRACKSTYGTGIFFTGMRSYKDLRYNIKEDVEIQSGTDVLNEDNFDEITHETWFFFPKNIHPMDFYLDDAALGQPDLQYAEDCIYKEKVSFKEFELMFGDNDAIDKEAYSRVTTGIDMDEKNQNSQSIHQDEIVLFYYYNRVTKDFYIVANEDNLLVQTKFLYNDGKLPFDSAQHFPNENCFYGRGIPERIEALKVYIGEILQDMLSGAQMANSINFLTGNDEQVNQDWSVWGRGVNIWKSTGGIEQVQRIDSSINLGYFQNMLNVLYDLVVQYTGDNPRAPIDMQTDKVGIMEAMEANKAVRQSAVDESYNICLDSVLTMMLSRIKQFAPALLSESIKDSEGKEIKKIFPKIRIDGAEVKQTKDQVIVTDKLGKYWYFELRPEVVQGLGVKVQTSSTSSILPILERQRITEMVQNVNMLANLGQIVPWLAEKLERYLGDDFLDYMDDAYGYDNGKLKAFTEKDKLDQENKKRIKELTEKSTLALKWMQNATPTNELIKTEQTQGNPTQNQGLWQGM